VSLVADKPPGELLPGEPSVKSRSGPESVLAIAGLVGLTEAVYLRLDILRGAATLFGSDYEELHVRRIAFAREALFGARHTLPGWYPHEVLGSPFAANLQSFPWIPTRLALLLLDPSIAYAAGIAIAAALSAIFTYLFVRRAGLSRTAAVASGWTFACAGYFASRVMAGHLPLLEAYPALPLLLWLVDRALAPERAPRTRFDLGVLALCTTCVVVAGHPQLPAYSVAAALLYTAFGGWGAVRNWARARVAAAIALGVGLSLAVWWPMLQLLARSTRLLRLDAPDNDVVMPYQRLLALIIPGIDGWGQPVALADSHPFGGYPNNSYFWDTASYVGLLPLIAIAALLAGCAIKKRLPHARWIFLSCLGIAAFICSLPVAEPLLHALPGTLLRSPARLLYVSTFCAAVALGASVDAMRRSRWPASPAFRSGLVIAALSLHFADLWGFSRRFIEVTPRENRPPMFQSALDRELGEGRIAQERTSDILPDKDRYGDAGGFDSIFLARFYRAYLALADSPAGLNRQWIDASKLPLKALEATGVKFVVTSATRADLQLVSATEDANLYRVADPAPWARFVPQAGAKFVTEQQIPAAFAADPATRLWLPAGSGPISADPVRDPSIAPRITSYSRPSSDEILLRAFSGQAGFVHVLEAYDPGWSATVDEVEAALIPANGFTIATPVPPGTHTIRLRYRTPGRTAGAALSLVSLGLLTVLLIAAKPANKEIWIVAV
jgi:hypothetical protein